MGIALVDEIDNEVFGERERAIEFIVNGDPVAAVADHICESEFVHAADGHGLEAACGDAEKMARFAAFLKGQNGGVRYVLAAVVAGEQSSVYVKEQISFFMHVVLPIFVWCMVIGASIMILYGNGFLLQN